MAHPVDSVRSMANMLVHWLYQSLYFITSKGSTHTHTGTQKYTSQSTLLSTIALLQKLNRHHHRLFGRRRSAYARTSLTMLAMWCRIYTCLKKVPTCNLAVTFLYLNRFSKFLQRQKAYKICYKTRMTLPTSP